MTKFLSLFTIIMVLFLSHSYAIPMDERAAVHLPALRKVVGNVLNGVQLSQDEQNLIEKCIESQDPVLLSISAWIMGETQDDVLGEKLESLREVKVHVMPAAFIQIALEKREAKKDGRKWMPAPEWKDSPNEYLRFEVIRLLLNEKNEEGMKALNRMQASKNSQINFVLISSIKPGESSTEKRFMICDEWYEMVLSVIQWK